MASSMAFDIFARDHASRTFDQVGDSAKRLERRLDGVGKSGGGLRGDLDGVGKSASGLGGHLDGLGDKLGGLGGHLSGLGGRLSSLAGPLTAAGSGLASIGVSVVGAAAKLGALTGALASATSSIGGLVAALAPAAGALAALPAALTLGAAAMGTLKFATSGLADVFSTALTGDVEEFLEAVGPLPEAVSTIAYELRALKPDLDNLRAAVQTSLFAPLVADLENTGDLLISVVRPGMVAVAGEFGRLGAAVLQFGQSASAIGLLKNTFETLQQILSNIQSNTLRDLLAAMAYFASSTLPAFDGLGEVVNRLAERFTSFLTTAAASGTALEWVENAKIVFQQLGAILADLGGVVSAVFHAMQTAAGDTLGVLGNMLDKLHAFLDSAQGQETLVAVFTALGQAADAFFPVLQAIAGTIGALAPRVAELATAVGPLLTAAINAVAPALAALVPGITAVIGGIRAGVESLAPALQPLGQALGGILAALAPVFSSIAKAITAALPGIQAFLLVVATGISSLAPALVPLAKAAGDTVAALRPLFSGIVVGIREALPGVQAFITALGVGLASVAPALVSLGRAFGAVMAALAPLLPVLGELVGVAGHQLGVAIRAVVPSLQELVAAFGQALSSLMPIVPVIYQVASTILSGLIPAIANLLPQFAALAGPIIQSLGNALLSILPSAQLLVNSFGQMLVALAPALPLIFQLAASIIGNLVPALAPLLPQIGELVTRLVQGLVPALLPLLPIIGDIVAIVGQTLVGVLGVLVGKIIEILPPLSEMAQLLGMALLKALQDIAPHLPALLDALLAWLPAMVDLLPSLTSLAVSLLPRFFDSLDKILPLLPDLIESMIHLNEVMYPLIPIFADLLEQMAPHIPLFIELAAVIAEKLIPPLTDFLVTVTTVVSGVLTKFTELYDRLIGHSIIPDLINGIGSWIGRLPGMFTEWVGRAKDAAIGKFNELVGAAAQIPGRIVSALGDLGNLLFNSGQSIIQGLINGLYSMLQNAYNAASDILGQIRNLFPFSPAKEGPFSGRGWTLFSGISMGEALAAGLAKSEGLVAKAADGLMGAASVSLTPSVAAGGQAPLPLTPQGGLTINLHFSGSPLVSRDEIYRMLISALNEARARGFNLGNLGGVSG